MSNSSKMKKNILVVDDSESIRELVGITLIDAGFDVIKAVNGKDAFKKLQKAEVDLVLTDLNMPEVDGIMLVKKIRKYDKYKYLPVLILTTESETKKRVEAKESGATGWIVKPFDKERLLNIIKKVIRK
jgi:two-component system chemotaxis response regulator CheY